MDGKQKGTWGKGNTVMTWFNRSWQAESEQKHIIEGTHSDQMTVQIVRSHYKVSSLGTPRFSKPFLDSSS